MAQRVQVSFVDDLDGSEGDVGTVEFGLDGATYEIDLSAANAERLRDMLEEFIAVARRVGGKSKPAKASKTAAPPPLPVDRERTRAIRLWAIEQGFQVSDRGRIPIEFVEAYDAAHQ